MRYALEVCDDEVIHRDGKVFIKFTGPCLGTGKPYSVEVPLEVVEEAMRSDRRHIQDMLPDMPIGDREFLISGFSPEGWDDMFGDLDDEDDDGETTKKTTGLRHFEDTFDIPSA